jgi:hypothetical protein
MYLMQARVMFFGLKLFNTEKGPADESGCPSSLF